MFSRCKDIAEQLSHNIDEPVTGLKALKLKFHLLICLYCRRYAKQIGLCAKTLERFNQQKKHAQQPSAILEEQVISDYKQLYCRDKR